MLIYLQLGNLLNNIGTAIKAMDYGMDVYVMLLVER